MSPRNEAICKDYEAGTSTAVIAQKNGLKQRRVIQILKDAGTTFRSRQLGEFSVKETLRRAYIARTESLWGVPFARFVELQEIGAVKRFRMQRHTCRSRGLEFSLTLQEWWEEWEKSGKYELCGRGALGYCLARIEDKGAYVAGNIEIRTNRKTSKEARLRAKKPNRSVTGNIHLLYPGLEKPWVAKYGKEFLGMFATHADAVEARKNRLFGFDR